LSEEKQIANTVGVEEAAAGATRRRDCRLLQREDIAATGLADSYKRIARGYQGYEEKGAEAVGEERYRKRLSSKTLLSG
jgi:hypothetical protein